MLKIWKQTWKKDSDARGVQSSGTSSGDSEDRDAVSSSSSSQTNLDPVMPHSRHGTKRAGTGELEEFYVDISDRPRKRIKYEDEETSLVNDILSNHPPEVIKTGEAVQSETSSTHEAVFEGKLLHEAKVTNSEIISHSLCSSV